MIRVLFLAACHLLAVHSSLVAETHLASIQYCFSQTPDACNEWSYRGDIQIVDRRKYRSATPAAELLLSKPKSVFLNYNGTSDPLSPPLGTEWYLINVHVGGPHKTSISESNNMEDDQEKSDGQDEGVDGDDDDVDTLLKSPDANALIFSFVVPLCRLVATQGKEVFHIHFDEHDKVFKVDYIIPTSECQDTWNPKESHSIHHKPEFRTSALSFSERPRLEMMPEMSQDGKPVSKEDNRGFFQRYWYYIIPFLVILLLGGGEDPQSQQKNRPAN